MTLIAALHNAVDALRQDQLALNATADNISNQNTLGYSRRQVNWTTRDSVSIGAATGIVSPVATVAAQRSAGNDRSVQQAQSDASAASRQSSALDSLQALFALDSSGQESSGISAALNGFFAALSSLASDPNGTVTRQSVYTATQAVVGAFHETSVQLKQRSASLDDDLRDSVATVNQLTQSVAALNGKILAAREGAERDALIDTRTAKIGALSELVTLSQTADQDGSINLATSNGAPLVSGSNGRTIDAGMVSGALHLFSNGTDITQGLEGGSIGGSLKVRDGNLKDTSARVDALAASFATALNTTNAAGKLADGSVGGALFSLPAGSSDAASLLGVVASDGNAFAAAGPSEGSGGNSNANALAALRAFKNSAGETFAQVMSAVVSQVGNAAALSQTDAQTTNAALTQANAQRDAESGISLDSEAANLTLYQRSYQAEAKLLAIVNEIMASSINLGTNTTVS